VNPYFQVCEYRVTSERLHDRSSQSQAIVEVRVGAECVRRSAMGCGPIHALDNALRACLRSEFPELERVRLADYRVSVVDAGEGTGAQVRVLIEATDGDNSWDAGSVSTNIIDASFEALCSAWVVGIMRERLGATPRTENALVMQT
jgi:2-isopropylmalate synthase